MTYQKYSTFTKQLFCTNHLQPVIRETIPYSTRAYWKQQYSANQQVYDPVDNVSTTVSNLKLALGILLDTLPQQKNKKKFWKKHIHTITAVMNECNSHTDKLQVLQHLNISSQAYAKWTSTGICSFSTYGLCAKKYPLQLLESEKSIIKQYMQNPQYQFRNRSQIYWQMRNDKALMINIKTFHKYCDVLGLYSSKQIKQDKRKIKGITANSFLEKIHLDITYLGLLDNTTAYVLNIVDNNTRKLLTSQASLVCNSSFVSGVLEPLIIRYNLNQLNTEIITDGGAENAGELITMLAKYPNIVHRVAKRDIPFLNNIAEACHKRFKNNILPHNYFTDITHLQQKLPGYVLQYNNLPQHHLQGLTPCDAKNGIAFDKRAHQQLSKEALALRMEKNKALQCCNIPT
jgi:hypothetical protein